MSTRELPRLLTIAGSDSGGGAGIQADLKTFASWRVYGMSALTAVTAQNTLAVTAVHGIPPEVVMAQIDAVFDDLGVDAVKIGMLGERAVVEAVAAKLAARCRVPIILDPVMVAKTGDLLLAADAREALAAELLPLATLVTPNLPEAEALLGRRLKTPEERRDGAGELASRGPAVLLKGGHTEGPEVVDLLATEGGMEEFRHPRLASRSTHGTGCTLSSAIAANLAWGRPLREAVERGIDFTHRAIAEAIPLGGGHGPVNHLVETECPSP
ncbi:MAG: bifunctional hydroxymethylpyrimidine kinase/phosphomethylpyrimidine kinase [Thermoanaerobaculia bacterium]